DGFSSQQPCYGPDGADVGIGSARPRRNRPRRSGGVETRSPQYRRSRVHRAMVTCHTGGRAANARDAHAASACWWARDERPRRCTRRMYEATWVAYPTAGAAPAAPSAGSETGRQIAEVARDAKPIGKVSGQRPYAPRFRGVMARVVDVDAAF